MTIESWVEEFYPVTAEDCPEADQLAHSLRKWEGLRPENLERHGLMGNSCGDLVSKFPEKPEWPGAIFSISAGTCALCVWGGRLGVTDNCRFCPIFMITEASCHDKFNEWLHRHDPEPMIQLLTKVLNMQLKEVEK